MQLMDSTADGLHICLCISSYSVIPDRIEAGTLLIAGAITKGDVTVEKVNIPASSCVSYSFTAIDNQLYSYR